MKPEDQINLRNAKLRRLVMRNSIPGAMGFPEAKSRPKLKSKFYDRRTYENVTSRGKKLMDMFMSDRLVDRSTSLKDVCEPISVDPARIALYAGDSVIIKAANKEGVDMKPAHKHDCAKCIFMGRYEHDGKMYDLYHCPNPSHTLIARYGEDGDYISCGVNNIKHFEDCPVMMEAHRLYLERCDMVCKCYWPQRGGMVFLGKSEPGRRKIDQYWREGEYGGDIVLVTGDGKSNFITIPVSVDGFHSDSEDMVESVFQARIRMDMNDQVVKWRGGSKITVHWDFTDGTEVSYAEGKKLQKAKVDFTTNCLDFFCSGNNATAIRQDSCTISSVDLLNNVGGHTNKHMRNAHNLHRMLRAGRFKWKNNVGDYVI